MKASDLLKLIQAPHQISPTVIAELNQVLERYPYFQLAYTLVAKIVYDNDPAEALDAIKLASIYATDRKHLKLLLENKLTYHNLVNNLGTLTSPQVYDKGSRGANLVDEAVGNPAEVDVKKPKGISDKIAFGQLNCIDKFITQPSRKIKIKNDEESLLQYQGKDFVEESVYSHPRLFTETLAQIMLKQDKFEKAIEIYQKLKKKFPEKSTYFENLIAQMPKSAKINN